MVTDRFFFDPHEPPRYARGGYTGGSPFQRYADERFRREFYGDFPPGPPPTPVNDEPAPVRGEKPKHGTATAKARARRTEEPRTPHDIVLLTMDLTEKLTEVAHNGGIVPDWTTFAMAKDGHEYVATVTCRRPTLELTAGGIWT